MAQFILNRFNKPPTNGRWRIADFSTLKSPASAYCGFYVPMTGGNGPEFNIFLYPRTHHRQSVGRIVIEYTEAGNKDRSPTNVHPEFRGKRAHFRLSFINGSGERCKTSEATMPLFANPDRLHANDIHLEFGYDHLLDPANDLLQDSTTLTILVEGSLVPAEPTKQRSVFEQPVERHDSFDAELTWTVRNVSDLRLIVSSPAFPLSDRSGLRVRLNLYPRRFYSPIHPNAVCIDVGCHNDHNSGGDGATLDINGNSQINGNSHHTSICRPEDTSLVFRLSIVDERGLKLLTHDGQARFNQSTLECNCPLLLSPKYLSKFTRNDKLIIFAQCVMFSEESVSAKKGSADIGLSEPDSIRSMFPNTQYWTIEHFSRLEYARSYCFRFYIPLSHHLPKFTLVLTPHDLTDPEAESVTFLVEPERTVNYVAADIPEQYRTKDAYLRISFLNGDEERCNTQEARLPLYKTSDQLYRADVQFSVPYSYFVEPKNDLLQGDTLVILIEGQIVDQTEQCDLRSEFPVKPATESTVESNFVQHHDSIEPFVCTLPCTDHSQSESESVESLNTDLESIPPLIQAVSLAEENVSTECAVAEDIGDKADLPKLVKATHEPPQRSFDLEHTWTIRHVSKMKAIFKSSEIFHPPTRKSFKLVYNPRNAFYGAESQFVGLTVELVDSEEAETSFRFRISIVDENENKCFTKDGEAKYVNFLDRIHGTYFTLSRMYLLDPRNAFTLNDRLTLHCEVELVDEL